MIREWIASLREPNSALVCSADHEGHLLVQSEFHALGGQLATEANLLLAGRYFMPRRFAWPLGQFTHPKLLFVKGGSTYRSTIPRPVFSPL